MKIKKVKNSLAAVMFIGIVGIFFTGCSGSQNENQTEKLPEEGEVQEVEYVQITQDEAKELMDTQENYIILDVRTQEEYDDGHIIGAICVPNETIMDSEPEALPDKEQLILVYCRSGNRSKQAAQKLADMGYSNVKEFGGIKTWKYETE